MGRDRIVKCVKNGKPRSVPLLYHPLKIAAKLDPGLARHSIVITGLSPKIRRKSKSILMDF